MTIYLATLVLSVFFCWRLQTVRELRMKYTEKSLFSGIYLLFLFLLLSIVVGWRNGVGTDYGNYIDIYTLTENKPYEEIWKERESLFGILNRFCADQFDTYIAVFAVCALISVALLLVGIYQESASYWLSMFLLITGMYYFDLFNGMRQMIATTVMFAAYPLARQKKWVRLLLITLVAYGFHESSYLVFLVFLFAAYARPGKGMFWTVIIIFSGVYLFYNSLIDAFVTTLIESGSAYANYEETLARLDLGANFLRFALTAVPVLFGCFAWKNLRQQREDAGMLLNISLINALFMLLATRNWIFARICMFFGIYNILLWPEILKCFEKKSRILMTWGVMIVYFAYFWLIVHTDSNLLPYESWLFGGVYA